MITTSIFSVNIKKKNLLKILRRKKPEDIDQSFNIHWQCIHEPGRRTYLKITLLEVSLLSEELTGALKATDANSQTGAGSCPWSPWPLFPNALPKRAQPIETVDQDRAETHNSFQVTPGRVAFLSCRTWDFQRSPPTTMISLILWVSEGWGFTMFVLLMSLQAGVGLHSFHQLLYSFQRWVRLIHME